MLDTGIDVPEVLNLVFFKPVKSKIKFVQMIGRGTRLCERLIDGKDKRFFLIFDYCGNFEYFDENPEGASLDNGKSLSQKLFDIKLEMLVELQKYEHQSNPEHKAYYDRLKPELYAKIKGIKENSKRISVRSKMDHLDKFVDYERWEALSILDKKEIQSHLSCLIDSDIDAAKGSLAFDMRMFQIELSVLATGKIDSAAKQVEKVRHTAKVLLEKASVTKVLEKADTLNEIRGTQMWENPTVSKLEKYREDIRELIQYIPPTHPVAIIDTDDEVETVDYTGNGLIDIRTYKEKVIDYLIEHTDNPTIKKIRNIEPINAEDVKELERILWNELGTKTEYEKEVHTNNLAAFIRSIVGVEQEAINEKFGQFLTGNILNSQQQEFLKSIIDYVRENGDIQMEDIIEKSPFDNYDVLTLFGPNVEVIKHIVNAMHNSIMAA